MKKIIVAVAALVCCCFISTFGQQVSSAYLPIHSQGELRSYGASIAKMGTRYGWCETSYQTQVQTNVIGNGAEDVLDGLFEAPLPFSFWKDRNYVNENVNLYDNIGFGYMSYFTDALPDYCSVWISQVPLLMLNVQSAEVHVLYDDGSVAYTNWVNMYNGHPAIQLWMTGYENNVLVTHNWDGTTSSYNMWKPATPSAPAKKHVPVSDSPWQIVGHHVLRTDKVADTLKIIEIEDADPSFLIETKHPTRIMFDVIGVYRDNDNYSMVASERPAKIVFDSLEGCMSHEPVNSKSDRPTYVTLPKGSFRGHFEWSHFGHGKKMYTGGIGIGKEEVTAASQP